MEKTKINSKILSVIFVLAFVASAVFTVAPVSATATCYTCDINGNARSTFNPGENVYLNALGLSPSTTYSLYVFIKGNWTSGAFPARYYNTNYSFTTDGLGNEAGSIYRQITVGEYCVAVDVNNNGVYDSGDDLLITNLVVTLEVTATSGGITLSTLYLTPAQLYAMPSYEGVGCPRRSSGYYPPEQIGNYTGVPMMFLCDLVGGLFKNSTMSSTIGVSTVVDYYSTSLSYPQVHDNIITPQYNISTGAVIYGQQPMFILAYKVNDTMLSSDGSGLGSNTDLGGPLRLIVIANNRTSPILANDGMATFGNSYVKAVTKIEIQIPGSLTYNTTNSAGTTKNTFNQNEDVHFSATGLSAYASCSIYVVNHVSAWAVRIAIPDSVSYVSVDADASGNIVTQNIYDGSQAGSYDVIVDLNNNGIYDEADLLIYNAAGTCGFSVS
jgi:hypothetical protein